MCYNYGTPPNNDNNIIDITIVMTYSYYHY